MTQINYNFRSATESLLGHVSGSLGGIRGVYQRYDYAAEKREAVIRWESYIASLLQTAAPNILAA